MQELRQELEESRRKERQRQLTQDVNRKVLSVVWGRGSVARVPRCRLARRRSTCFAPLSFIFSKAAHRQKPAEQRAAEERLRTKALKVRAKAFTAVSNVSLSQALTA